MDGRRVNRPHRLLAAPRSIGAVLGLLLVLSGSRLPADEIHLLRGGVVEGRIVFETPTRIVVEVPYGRWTVERREIERIVRESESDYLRRASDRVIRVGDHDEALRLLRRRHELRPEDAAARAELRGALRHAAGRALDRRELRRAEALLEELPPLGGEEEALPLRARLGRLVESRVSRETAALAAWNTGDAPAAIELWEALRREFPADAERWRTPLATATLRAAHDALLGRRHDEAARLYRRTLDLDPRRLPEVREPLALCTVERALRFIDEGRPARAESEIMEVLGICPEERALLFHHALILEGRGDYRTAGELYARLAGEEHRAIEGAAYLRELRSRAADRLQGGVALDGPSAVPPPPEGEAPPGRTTRDGPFRIHSVGDEAPSAVLAALTRSLDELRRDWFGGHAALPDGLVIDVHLHADRAALSSVVETLSAGCDGFVLTERNFGVLLRQELHLNAASPQLVAGVIPHELAHLLLAHRLGGVRLPPWLDEGIAVGREPSLLRGHRDRLVEEAREAGRLLPVVDLLAADAIPTAGTDLFYAQSASLVRFLQKRLGRKELLEFARTVAVRGIEPALSEHAGYATVADLQLAWKRSLAE